MRPFLYEMKRAFTSKTVIIIMIVMVLVSIGIGYGLQSSLSSQNTSPATTPYYDYTFYYTNSSGSSNGSYHGVFSFFNGYGLPISGVTLNLTFSSLNNKTVTEISDSDGYANLTVNNVSESAISGLHGNFSYPSQYFPHEGSISVFPGFNGTDSYFAPGMTVPGTISTALVKDPFDPAVNEIHLFYVGANGTKAPEFYVYYKGVNNTGISGPIEEGNMSYFGKIGGFYTMNLNLNLPKNSSYSAYDVAFTTSQPNKQQTTYNLSAQYTLLNRISSPVRTDLFFSVTSAILTFFVPLMAILVGYLTYGRDRASGVLESVIVRPVTKIGAMSSRYIATMSAILLSIAISIFVVDLFMNYYFDAFVSIGIVLNVIWDLAVEAAAFLGIMYILSHVLKGQGGILGIGIALFLVLVLFWSLLIMPLILIEVFHYVIGSPAYTHAQTVMFYINPGSYMSLMETISLNELSSSLGQSVSTYGITAVNVVVAGILWIVVPLGIAMYLARSRD